MLHFEMLPVLKMLDGVLLVESQSVAGRWNTVDMVVFHGIFENDLDTLTMLALWGGPCLPAAQGMMDLRSRIPGLARALNAQAQYAAALRTVDDATAFADRQGLAADWDGRAVLLSTATARWRAGSIAT